MYALTCCVWAIIPAVWSILSTIYTGFVHHPFFVLHLYMKYQVCRPNFFELWKYHVTTKYGRMWVWSWPLDPKIYSCLPSIVFHLCMKYQVCRLKTVLSCHITTKYGSMTLTFDLKIYRCLPFLSSVYKVYRLKTVLVITLEESLTLTSCLPFFVLHLCKKYKVYTV